LASTALPVVALLAALMGSSGCSASSGQVFRAEPTPTPSASMSGSRCLASGQSLGSGQSETQGLVTVDAHPRGLTAFWIPGFDQRPCRTVRTHYGASVASRLADDLRTAPRYPKGVVHCPNDTGAAVYLYFGYGAGRPSEFARAQLTGCRFVIAPNRESRRLSDRLISDLAAIAPQPWADGLRQPAG
jgi:hypothetical protein